MIGGVTARISGPQPHCVAWMRATASLWGNVDGHDLDEPVRLSEEHPARLRYRTAREIVCDRALALRAERAGTSIMLRFRFRSGEFFETPILGIAGLAANEVAEVSC